MTSNQYLPELPGEVDEAQKASVREAVSSKAAGLEAFGHMSDEWVAARVRMLMRSDLWHEPICSAGRDRIIRLSQRVAELEAEIKERKFFDSIPTASPEKSAEMIAEARRQGRLPPQTVDDEAHALATQFGRMLEDTQVPNEPLEVYTSNSFHRVGLRRTYREVLCATCDRSDGHPNFSNYALLDALVCAFNAMLARRATKTAPEPNRG